MTEQEQKAFTAMREALEVLNNLDADINFLNTNELEDMMDKALTAANAVSEQPQEPKLPEYFAQYEYAPDFSVVVSVYRRHADAVPELIHSEALPKQIGDYPQTSEPTGFTENKDLPVGKCGLLSKSMQPQAQRDAHHGK